ncbi:hypothetical protein QQF64_033045 [Cirrhinus molitorella]|uniref:Reverse transcriptase domain-containing protein n=1 Tax=Cirrhinus molitorella TaxID=172907 RepID=A0ABR3MSX1_9TELE
MAVSKVPQHDMLLITGDMNAKVGTDNSNYEKAMGTHGHGTKNNNGERLVDFCLNNNLVIGGTIFPHKNIHKLTWKSPDGRTINQIDHIIINCKWRRSLQDVRAYRGADAYSDHYLLVATIKLKLKKLVLQRQRQKMLDIAKIQYPKKNKKFVLEVRNCVSTLDATSEKQEPTVNQKCNIIKNIYSETAQKVLGFKQRGAKEWISANTWQKIEERKQLKAKLLNLKSQRLIEKATLSYKNKDREVKRSARRDKRVFAENLAREAEKAAAFGNLGAVYKISRQLCGNHTIQNTLIRDKKGNICSSEHEQAARWVQHFQEVLNHPEPDQPANITTSDNILDINTNPPDPAEVKSAILSLKCGKACGLDVIHAEMLKADISTSTKVFTDLFQNIWDSETIPEDWSRGLIVKIPKKGDTKNCDNWRGISLLSIPSKVFCRVLLNRIEPAIDTRLRQEQAGFRKGRGCMDQIFTLRNILEQCLEWNTPLYINFVDFKKAFDSVHRSTLWKILHHYGIPPKIIAIIQTFYEKFECSVLMNNTLTEWFSVQSGVRQGCIISPILFLLTVDWITTNTTADKSRGIQWTLSSQLEDLDFADDLALLSTNLPNMQSKTDMLNKYAKQAGLNINTSKTQVMCINTIPTASILVNGAPLEFVEDFTYLGSLISNNNAVQKDIRARLGKAQGAFSQLRSIWSSKQYSLKTKMLLYNSNVKSVLLYGAESWHMVATDMKRLEVFHNRCLRIICQIFWPNKISNQQLYKKTGSQSITKDVTLRCLRWLGHVLRMEQEQIPRVALRWTPPGKRKPGHPKNTWRRTVVLELQKMNMSWGEAQHVAKDHMQWRELIEALCPIGDEEE